MLDKAHFNTTLLQTGITAGSSIPLVLESGLKRADPRHSVKFTYLLQQSYKLEEWSNKLLEEWSNKLHGK